MSDSTSLLRHARVLLALALASAWMLVAAAAPAHAHTELRESSPAEGEIVESIDQVVLDFSSDILDVGVELTIVDGNDERHELDPVLDGSTRVTAEVPAIATGAAQLEWRVVAADGHPISGEIAFQFIPLEPTEAPAPEPTMTPSPTASPSPTAEPSPAPVEVEDEDEDETLPLWAGVLIALAVVAVAVTAIVLARRRR